MTESQPYPSVAAALSTGFRLAAKADSTLAEAEAAYLSAKAYGRDGVRACCLPPRLEHLLNVASLSLCCAAALADVEPARADAVALVDRHAEARDITRGEADFLRGMFDRLAEMRRARGGFNDCAR